MSKWLSVQMAWRKGETEVASTVTSATASIVDDGEVVTIEDKHGHGPGRTRHRGIVAAKDAKVIIIVDPHMVFDGDVLRKMGEEVKKNGGLYCAVCHHNEKCEIGAKHPSGAGAYCGAHIDYKALDKDQYPTHNALCWKWNEPQAAGPIGCVGGACYAFSRDWYFSVGEPLNALPHWGGDEEALSISAWLSGIQPMLFDGHVAHRWRARPPWKLTERESLNVLASRFALIHGVVSDQTDRAELVSWQRKGIKNPAKYTPSPEVVKWQNALLKQPRTWKQWRAEVCQGAGEAPPEPPKPPIVVAAPAPSAPDPRACPHCQQVHEDAKVINRYPNGKTTRECPNTNKRYTR